MITQEVQCNDIIKTISSLFIFFYEKVLSVKKHSQAKINQQNKIKQTLNNKGNNFLLVQTSKRLEVVCFTFWCFLCAQNLFVKKINRLEIALMTSFYYTTDVYPYQSTHVSSHYLYALFLFLTICEKLFESFLSVIICENLFFQVFMKISKLMNSII